MFSGRTDPKHIPNNLEETFDTRQYSEQQNRAV